LVFLSVRGEIRQGYRAAATWKAQDTMAKRFDEERAAIREYEGGYPRPIAEHLARWEAARTDDAADRAALKALLLSLGVTARELSDR
jgi:hypothetical protein